jgi:hypothetical protein
MNLLELDKQYKSFVNSKYCCIALAIYQEQNVPFQTATYILLMLFILTQNEFIQAYFLKGMIKLPLEFLDI